VVLAAPEGAEVTLEGFEFASPDEVPEPPTVMLFGILLVGAALSRRAFGTRRA
jgi:hypothetical protein